MVRAKIGRKSPRRSPRCWCLIIPRNFGLIPFDRWHNVPPGPSKLKTTTSAEVVQESGAMQPDPDNSLPFDFETFIPNHDPSLPQPSQQAFETYGIPPAPREHVSRDEAFNRALGAMYWAGYWTAVYHVSHHTNWLIQFVVLIRASCRVMNIMTVKGSHPRLQQTACIKKKKMRMWKTRTEMKSC